MVRKIISALCLLLLTYSAQATVYYVDGGRANNTGNGQSWAAAKKDVQEAISLAVNAGDEVWVKGGTYLPTLDPNGFAPTGTDVRYKMFYVKTQDIKLYGGFAGTETLATQRNPAANTTILSGDLDGAGGTNDACHVLLTLGRSTDCVIDGFTITGGRANFSSITVTTHSVSVNGMYGGGMHNASNSSPTVSNCTFTSNTASSFGGAMYNAASCNAVVTNCVFTSNVGSNYGGGIYNTGNAPVISSCSFNANTGYHGGGVYNTNATPVISSCTFSNNVATVYGGGISNNGTTSATVTGSTFTGNTAQDGGGVYNYPSAGTTFTLTDCNFFNNTAAGNGGGLANLRSNTTITNCSFDGNTALDNSRGGGGIYNVAAVLSLNNCTFTANTANNGGGMYNFNGASMAVSSSTFSGNTATLNGGGIFWNLDAGGSITNCILYGNTGTTVNRADIYKNGISRPLTVSYSLIGDYIATGTKNYTSGAGILSGDPLFVDAANPKGADGIFRTADDGLRLLACSPAINSGTGTTPATDILGNSRIGGMDLGAYEYQGSAAVPVLATTTTSATQTLISGSTIMLGNCGNIIASVQASATNPASGDIAAKVYVQSTAPVAGTQPYGRRHYDISPATNPNTATAQITLYFTQADFDDYNNVRGGLPPLPVNAADAAGNKSNIRITQQHGTSATGLPGSYTGWSGTGPANVLITPGSVIWNASASRWEVNFGVTGFSGFFLTSSIGAPLPVHLLQFTARRTSTSQNQLSWSTGTEDPGTVFNVERSGDGSAFEKIGVVSGAGKGNTYSFKDNAPLKGDNYYRLQIEENNTFGYSAIVRITGEGKNAGTLVTISPVPATHQVTLRCSNAAWYGQAAHIADMNGRVVAQFILSEQVTIPTGLWIPGVYVARMPDGSALRILRQ